MKVAQFNELCRSEHERDGGTVARLHLTGESYAELRAEVLADKPPEWAGLELSWMTNPATFTPVDILLAAPFVSDTAEVKGHDPRVIAVPLPIEIRRRDPAEARARILASDLPGDLKAALAGEIGPET